MLQVSLFFFRDLHCEIYCSTFRIDINPDFICHISISYRFGCTEFQNCIPFALIQVCARHEKTHKKDRSEFCAICGKSFPDQGKLKLHQKRRCCLKKLKLLHSSEQINAKTLNPDELVNIATKLS